MSSQYCYAGFWIRVLAALIDTFLSVIIVMPLALWFGPGDYYTLEAENFTLFDGFVQFFSAAIYIFCWLKFAGTPGKILLKLKVLDAATGNKISLSQGLIRYLGYFVSAIVFCLGFFWIGFDPKKQGWHDKMAKTVVVKEID